MDSDDEVARLHTRISAKFYCIFAEDGYSTITEPSSDEDEQDEQEGPRDNRTRRIQQSTNPSHPLVHNSSMVVHPSTPPTPPTSPVTHSNPLQRGQSLATMSMLLSTIWAQEFIPTSGRYDSIFVASNPIIEQVYKLATSGS